MSLLEILCTYVMIGIHKPQWHTYSFNVSHTLLFSSSSLAKPSTQKFLPSSFLTPFCLKFTLYIWFWLYFSYVCLQPCGGSSELGGLMKNSLKKKVTIGLLNKILSIFPTYICIIQYSYTCLLSMYMFSKQIITPGLFWLVHTSQLDAWDDMFGTKHFLEYTSNYSQSAVITKLPNENSWHLLFTHFPKTVLSY